MRADDVGGVEGPPRRLSAYLASLAERLDELIVSEGDRTVGGSGADGTVSITGE